MNTWGCSGRLRRLITFLDFGKSVDFDARERADIMQAPTTVLVIAFPGINEHDVTDRSSRFQDPTWACGVCMWVFTQVGREKGTDQPNQPVGLQSALSALGCPQEFPVHEDTDQEPYVVILCFEIVKEILLTCRDNASRPMRGPPRLVTKGTMVGVRHGQIPGLTLPVVRSTF